MSREVIHTIVKEINCGSQYHSVIADKTQDYGDTACRGTVSIFTTLTLGCKLEKTWLQFSRHPSIPWTSWGKLLTDIELLVNNAQ